MFLLPPPPTPPQPCPPSTPNAQAFTCWCLKLAPLVQLPGEQGFLQGVQAGPGWVEQGRADT